MNADGPQRGDEARSVMPWRLAHVPTRARSSQVTKGTLMWCRHQDKARLEVPMPLRQTLRREGIAAIGKGTSSCTAGSQPPSLDLVAQLVGDAVIAASRSPFLSGRLLVSHAPSHPPPHRPFWTSTCCFRLFWTPFF